MSPRLIEIRRAVALLAAPAQEQEEHLSKVFHSDLSDSYNVDELALEFDDVASARAAMFDAGEISLDQYRSLEVLDNSLVAMSGGDFADLWTVRALREDRRWSEIRQIASECLRKLEEALR